MDEPDPAQLKQAHAHVWGKVGDYAAIGEQLESASVELLERLGDGAGMRLLDVATGTGNLAIPAARRGWNVTAIDLASEMLDKARARDSGATIEWAQGDAEDLGVAVGSFDAVASVFGSMFAPRHQVVADELARVARPGATIAFCAWTPDGLTGHALKATADVLPEPPSYAQPAVLWGDADHVSKLFGSAVSFDFELVTHRFHAESVDDYLAGWEANSGVFIVALAAAKEQGREEEIRRSMRAAVEAFAYPHPDGVEIHGTYLRAIGTRSGG